MRKLLASAVIAMGLLTFAAAAGASASTLPVGVEGTTSFSNHGTKVTVGYSACGYPNADGTFSGATPYFAHIDPKGNSGSVNVYTGGIDALNSFVQTSYGFPLTDAAIAQLQTDASTLTCTL